MSFVDVEGHAPRLRPYTKVQDGDPTRFDTNIETTCRLFAHNRIGIYSDDVVTLLEIVVTVIPVVHSYIIGNRTNHQTLPC